MELKNVRSLLKGEVGLDEIKEILSASRLGEKYINYYLDDSANAEYDTVVCDGDLVVDVDFDPYNFNICNLIVKGNLTVAGLMTFYNDPATLVFVGGDLTADDLVTADGLEVLGSVNIKNAILCMRQTPLYVHGDLTAELMLPGDAIVGVAGQRCVKRVFEYSHRIKDEAAWPYLSDRELYLLLRDDAFTDPMGIEAALAIEEVEWNDYDYYSYVNFGGIVGMLVKHESIYRS